MMRLEGGGLGGLEGVVEEREGVGCFLRYSSGAEGRGEGIEEEAEESSANSLSLSLDSCCVTSAIKPVNISSANAVSW